MSLSPRGPLESWALLTGPGYEEAVSPFLLLAPAYSWLLFCLGWGVELWGEDLWVPCGVLEQLVLGEKGLLFLQGSSGSSVDQEVPKLQVTSARCGQAIRAHLL